MLPELSWIEENLDTTPDSDFFWRSATAGRLRIQSCTSCAYLIHPPSPYCPRCGGRDVAPQSVGGRATLYSFTEVHHGTRGGVPVVVAMVSLDEQPDLVLMTNLVGIAREDIRIGMPLEVTFRAEGTLGVPVFGAADAQS